MLIHDWPELPGILDVSVHSNSTNVDIKKCFQFTTSWDDGTIHDLRLAELLTKYNLPATFYIAQKHEYGFLQEKYIAELGQHFEIGAHTLNHVVLSTADKGLVSDEIRGRNGGLSRLRVVLARCFAFLEANFTSSI